MSDKIPEIRTDKDTGKRYVKIGSKRFWLAKGVDKKNLLKFLKSIRKKSTKKKIKAAKKTTKKKKGTRKSKKVERKMPYTRGSEAVARSFADNAALSTARILSAAPRPYNTPVDTDQLVNRMEQRMKQLIPPPITSTAVIPLRNDDGTIDIDGTRMSGRQIKNGVAVLQNKLTKAQIEKNIAKLERKIQPAHDKVNEAARLTLEKRRGKTPMGEYLKKKAKLYNIPGTRIDQLIAPVMKSMIDDPDEKSFPAVTKAERELQDLENAITKLKEERDGYVDEYPEPSPEPQPRRSRVQISEIVEDEPEEKYPPRNNQSSKKTGIRRQDYDDSEEEYTFEDAAVEPTMKHSTARDRGKNFEQNWYEDEEDDEYAKVNNKAADQYYQNMLKQRTQNTWHQNMREKRVSDHMDRQQMIDKNKQLRDEQEKIADEIDYHARLDEINARSNRAIARMREMAVEEKTDHPEAENEINETLNTNIAYEENTRLSNIADLDRMYGKVQSGNGRGQDLGLSTDQINNLMKGYPYYIGCIGSNEIDDLEIKPHSRFGFVVNTDPNYKPGDHWIAVLIDARPEGDHSVEFYNSLADPPSRQMFKDIRALAAEASPKYPLRWKLNKIADQSNTSSNCGYFAAKFLIDRFDGMSFSEASGYTNRHPIGERNIEIWKKHLGVEPFRDINQQNGDGFRDVVRSGVRLVKRGYEIAKKVVNRVDEVLQGIRRHASPSVRSWLAKYGDLELWDAKVCRKPIFSVIENLANTLSEGKWEENKQKLSYDRMFHLFMLIRVDTSSKDGESKPLTFKIEKNHVVEIKSASWETGKDTESIPYRVDTTMTMNKFFAGAEKRVGAEKLWVYDARTQNCQFFLKWMFDTGSQWTDKIDKFVMQSAEKVLDGLGLLGEAAKAVTDLAAVADVAMNGKGEHRRGRGGRR